MPLVTTPALGRRHVLLGGLAAIVAPDARAAPALVPTPAQTAGPFYPPRLPLDRDADLVVVRGEAARAQGIVTHVRGRVLARDGTPLPGAVVEIWQCDAHGRYLHPADTGGRPRDPGFQGYGVVQADGGGGYGFRTIRPMAYPGRTPHIHFAVTAPGRAPLVTQMYVAGDPRNARDGVLNAIRDPRGRASVQVALARADRIEPGALAGSFDIVLA